MRESKMKREREWGNDRESDEEIEEGRREAGWEIDFFF